ncbi:MAG: phenylacetate-CoA oxygenase subunit PaaC [Cryomorphaceae bacterium]|jgi:ring-1,2-phenylacetyl-CoA epoxidase subunit PaaC|nr:phenylacetate-CoA oxygenase subunit PaaC [Cryomorphaceae bacterium]
MQDQALFEYVLRLADDSLILGQRLGEWCGHGPILEEDIALTNISLDLIGQAISLYDLAAELEGAGKNHDQLAYLRFENEYKNVLLVEQPNGDFAMTILRQFFFDAFRLPLYEALMQSPVSQLAAIAAKSVKETRYHLKHTSEWVIRMGDGTDESHERAQAAIDHLWRYTSELFYEDNKDEQLQALEQVPSLKGIQANWMETVKAVLYEATLAIPTNNWKFEGGREGRHSEHMGYILADLQYMQRAYPNMEW